MRIEMLEEQLRNKNVEDKLRQNRIEEEVKNRLIEEQLRNKYQQPSNQPSNNNKSLECDNGYVNDSKVICFDSFL